MRTTRRNHHRRSSDRTAIDREARGVRRSRETRTLAMAAGSASTPTPTPKRLAPRFLRGCCGVLLLALSLSGFAADDASAMTTAASTTTTTSTTTDGNESSGAVSDSDAGDSRPPPLSDLDCAIRRYAYEFSIEKLPRSSSAERRSVRDALRLWECDREFEFEFEFEFRGKGKGEGESSKCPPLPSPPHPEEEEDDDDRREAWSSSKSFSWSLSTDASSPTSVATNRRVRTRKRKRGLLSNERQRNETTPTTPTATTTRTTSESEAFRERLAAAHGEIPGARNEVLLFVDPENGDDDDGASGSILEPLRTIEAALAVSRQRQCRNTKTNTNDDSGNDDSGVTIVLRGGRYYLKETIRLDSRDRDLALLAYPGETPVLSGGDPLSLTLRPTARDPRIYSAGLGASASKSARGARSAGAGASSNDEGDPGAENPYNFTTLFLVRSAKPSNKDNDNDNDNDKDKDDDIDNENENDDDIRLVWAREPNGHPERDLQPDGYARANGRTANDNGDGDADGDDNDDGDAVHVVIGKGGGPSAARNSTIYPWHGEDLDPRGGGHWLHYGGTGNRFADRKGYWNGTVPGGLRYVRSASRRSGCCSRCGADAADANVTNTNTNTNVTNTNTTTVRGGTMNTSGWTPEGYAPAIAHVFHNAFWGNWQFKVETVENEDEDEHRGGDCDRDCDCGSTATATATTTKHGRISFSRGGWQEGRGGDIRNQPFFVEGVREALDEPGEWWLDVPNQVLFYYPFGNETEAAASEPREPDPNNNDNTPLPPELEVTLVAPRLQRIVEIVGENPSEAKVATGIALGGITFAHTATTFLEPYEVPSPGDWSVHRGGAVYIENARGATVIGCRFLRTGGNALVLSGHAKRSVLARNEFAFVGDSAIVTIGRLHQADGFAVDTFPEDTRIEANHFHDIGVHGKQTAALFSALSCRTTFVSNVAYNGPRAGINLNDQFCHGHTIRDNLLFNWVRETQDHGPINTWDRALYLQRKANRAANNDSDKDQDQDHDHDHDNGTGASDNAPIPTLIPSWAHIERNFIMNGPSGNRDLGNLFPTIDNDDGSSYYYIANNFLVYGGAKNYLGHDKRWIDNLLVSPGRWSGDPCAQIWGGENHLFEGNTCVVVPGDPPIGLDGSMEGAECLIDWGDSESEKESKGKGKGENDDPKRNENENNLRFVGKTAANVYYLDPSQEWGFGCGNGTSKDHFFSLEELQSHGWEIGSVVRDRDELNSEKVIALAKTVLEDERPC